MERGIAQDVGNGSGRCDEVVLEVEVHPVSLSGWPGRRVADIVRPMPTAHLNGIDTYFEHAGEGRPLLFLNASGATLASAGLLVQPFTGVADTVAADQRGLGRTEVPPGPYSMADYAADALALADHVVWDTFALVGVSFGGMVAQEVAVTAPERIERLALLCTSPGGPDAASYPLDSLAGLPPAERLATGMRVLDSRFTPDGWPTTRSTR